jgi:hypothetical protein
MKMGLWNEYEQHDKPNPYLENHNGNGWCFKKKIVMGCDE